MGHRLLQYLAFENNNRNDEYEDTPDFTKDRTAKKLVQLYFPNVNITSVKTVNNNYLQGMYELKKMEYKSRYGHVEEKLLFHSTSSLNVESIIKDNLDWRRVTRNKYGRGVSFSDDADYANYHSNRCNGSARAFLIAKVLVSNKVFGSCNMEIPPNNIDTSYSSNGKVYVKYCDNEFFIQSVVYYDAPELTESKHHRFRRRWFL